MVTVLNPLPPHSKFNNAVTGHRSVYIVLKYIHLLMEGVCLGLLDGHSNDYWGCWIIHRDITLA